MKNTYLTYVCLLYVLPVCSQEGNPFPFDTAYNYRETITTVDAYLPAYAEVFDGTHFDYLENILLWDKKDWKRIIEGLYDHDEGEAYAMALGMAHQVGVDLSDIDGMLADLAAWDDPLQWAEDLAVSTYLAQGAGMKEVFEELYKAVLPKSGLALPVWDNVLGSKIKNKTAEENARLLVRYVLDLATTRRIEAAVTATLLNQVDIKEKKKLATVLRQLLIADTRWEFRQAAALRLPEGTLRYSAMLQDLYGGRGNTFLRAKALFRALNILDSERPHPDTKLDLERRGRESAYHRAILQSMALRRKKLLAKVYNTLAARKVAKAGKLWDKVDEDGFFEMTEAQRLQVHRLVDAYQLEAVGLKRHADRLVAATVAHRGLRHKATATYYQHLKYRDLSRTPTIK